MATIKSDDLSRAIRELVDSQDQVMSVIVVLVDTGDIAKAVEGLELIESGTHRVIEIMRHAMAVSE